MFNKTTATALCTAALVLLCTACGQTATEQTSSTQTAGGLTSTQSTADVSAESEAPQVTSKETAAQASGSVTQTTQVQKRYIKTPASVTETTTVSVESRLPKGVKEDERFGRLILQETKTREDLNGRVIDYYKGEHGIRESGCDVEYDHDTGELLFYRVDDDTWDNRPQNGPVLTAEQRRAAADRYAAQYVDLSQYAFDEEQPIDLYDRSYTLYYTKEFAGYRSKDYVKVYIDKYGNFNHISMEGIGLLDGVPEPQIDKEKVAKNLHEQIVNHYVSYYGMDEEEVYRHEDYVMEGVYRYEYITMKDDKLVIEYNVRSMTDHFLYVDVASCLK